jgi:uncharacterized protein YdbL (DUF1318 family)
MKLDSRTYLNVILTVIAVLLVALVMQVPTRLDTTTAAYAATREPGKDEQQTRYLSALGSGGDSAAATQAVAKANEQIAREVGEVAKAIQLVSKSVDKMAAAKARAN